MVQTGLEKNSDWKKKKEKKKKQWLEMEKTHKVISLFISMSVNLL